MSNEPSLTKLGEQYKSLINRRCEYCDNGDYDAECTCLEDIHQMEAIEKRIGSLWLAMNGYLNEN